LVYVLIFSLSVLGEVFLPAANLRCQLLPLHGEDSRPLFLK
jgi:hypothetical protein